MGWHASQACSLPKTTTNPALPPDSQRTVHTLCPFGKAFYSALWHKCQHTQAPNFSHGYRRHRRRETANAQHQVLRYRFRQLHFFNGLASWDMKNAFLCPLHVELDKLIKPRTTRHGDVALLRQRYRNATTTCKAIDGDILLAIGSGALPGDKIAADLFR